MLFLSVDDADIGDCLVRATALIVERKAGHHPQIGNLHAVLCDS